MTLDRRHGEGGARWRARLLRAEDAIEDMVLVASARAEVRELNALLLQVGSALARSRKAVAAEDSAILASIGGVSP